MKLFTYSFLLALLFNCQNNAQKSINALNGKSKIEQDLMKAKPTMVPLENGKARAYFASGWFLVC